MGVRNIWTAGTWQPKGPFLSPDGRRQSERTGRHSGSLSRLLLCRSHRSATPSEAGQLRVGGCGLMGGRMCRERG